jgi:hypothetical protein
MADTTTGAVSAWEAAVAASANKVTSGGAGAAVAGVLSSSNFIAYAGLAIALAGFIVNWVYKRKHFKLAERESNARLADRGFYDEG